MYCLPLGHPQNPPPSSLPAVNQGQLGVGGPPGQPLTHAHGGPNVAGTTPPVMGSRMRPGSFTLFS